MLRFTGSARRALTATAVAVGAVASAGVAATPAMAAQTTALTFQCKYPLVAPKSLTVRFDLDAPTTWPEGTPTTFPFKTTVTGGGVDAFDGLVDGLASLKASTTTKATIHGPDATEFPVSILTSSSPTPLSPWSGTGQVTWPGFDYGDTTLVFDRLLINMTALNAAGQPLRLPAVPKDWDNNPIADSDGNPDTFDVICRLSPAQQNTTLGHVTIGHTDPCEVFDACPQPAAPTNIQVAPAADGTARISWSPIPFPGHREGWAPVEYVVSVDGRTFTTTATSVAVSLDPAREYSGTVQARYEPSDPDLSTSAAFTVPVQADPTSRFRYALAGSATLKTLTTGSLPLKGSIDARFSLATGTFVADLALGDTTGRLTALGFLPVTAKIGFAPSGDTTGTLSEGVLTSNSRVRIKVKEAKLFGAIPLAGGNNCQTKQLSDITLKSTGTFSPQAGGRIAGTFAISDLNGCGVLNGLVSPLTAGGGNTISLDLAPAP